MKWAKLLQDISSWRAVNSHRLSCWYFSYRRASGSKWGCLSSQVSGPHTLSLVSLIHGCGLQGPDWHHFTICRARRGNEVSFNVWKHIRTIETGGAQAGVLVLCTECVHPAYLMFMGDSSFRATFTWILDLITKIWSNSDHFGYDDKWSYFQIIRMIPTINVNYFFLIIICICLKNTMVLKVYCINWHEYY